MTDSPYDPDLDTALDEEWGPPRGPEPLTDDELEQLQVSSWTGAGATMAIGRLVATVEQYRRERDAAYTVIAQLTDSWDPEEQAEPDDSFWTPAEVDAISRARAVPGAETETTHE